MARVKTFVRFRIRSSGGSVSLEAAIALPVLIGVVVAISFLLRAVRVYEYVQHAISQAALEIAGVSYIYGAAGALDVQREAEAFVERGVGKVTDTIKKSTQFDSWLPKEASDEVDKQLADAAPALNDRMNGALFGAYAKQVANKYINGGGGTLAGSNIAGGADGLDFTLSTYLANGSEDVIVGVRYEFDIPTIIGPLSKLAVSQAAYARAWLYGAGAEVLECGGGEDEDDIWNQSNFARGLKIRELFHANLPQRFPVIAAYSDGVATSIHSLDTTAASYAAPSGIKKQIEAYVSELCAYSGQENPYGRERIVIPAVEIISKRLVLVIPRNEISTEASAQIDRCVGEALSRGIILQVERYSTKKVEDKENG